MDHSFANDHRNFSTYSTYTPLHQYEERHIVYWLQILIIFFSFPYTIYSAE